MSFYRTYRPQLIEEIDNLAVREVVLRLLLKPVKDLPHAFLCSGPRGAGKTTTARLIAKLFNCEQITKTGPCGTCYQCVATAQGKNLDVLELDAASNRGIDEIRQIRDAINLAPIAGRARIYIIDEVHMLTTEAFNALLKTLEEPPSHVVFILATTDPQKVPVTIQSRCVPITFLKASPTELVHALKRIVDLEHMTIDDDALTLIASQVDGSFRDAVKQLEQLSFISGAITPDVVRQTLSLGDLHISQHFLEALQQKNANNALGVVEVLLTQGKDIRLFIAECLKMLELSLVESIRLSKKSPWSLRELADMSRELSRAYAGIKGSAIPQLPLELAIVEYCELAGQPFQMAPAGVVGFAPSTGESTQSGSPASTVSTTPIVKKDVEVTPVPSGTLTRDKLSEHWPDLIAELKNHNHSISGVMRSTRPKSVTDGIVTIEAFFTFHKDKLSESKTRDMLAMVLYKLFGEKVRVEIVLGKK